MLANCNDTQAPQLPTSVEYKQFVGGPVVLRGLTTEHEQVIVSQSCSARKCANGHVATRGSLFPVAAYGVVEVHVIVLVDPLRRTIVPHASAKQQQFVTEGNQRMSRSARWKIFAFVGRQTFPRECHRVKAVEVVEHAITTFR